jgi:hypothetical protein
MGASSSAANSHSHSRSQSQSQSGTRHSGYKNHWKANAPNGIERRIMLEKCGKKCFLGPGTSFPVCTRKTCDINHRGVQSAYTRAREWASVTSRKNRSAKNAKLYRRYNDIADRAKQLLKKTHRR